MTHCRECNSEIAEAEAFCPFCGISITPPKVVPDSVADESEDAAEESLQSEGLPIDGDDGADKADADVEDSVDEGSEAASEVSETEFVDVSALKSDEKVEPEPAEEETEAVETEVEEADDMIRTTGDLRTADAEAKQEKDGVDAEVDAEIEEAVSAIDRKADMWREKAGDEAADVDKNNDESAGVEDKPDSEPVEIAARFTEDGTAEVPADESDEDQAAKSGAGTAVAEAADEHEINEVAEAEDKEDKVMADVDMEATLIDNSVFSTPEPKEPEILVETPEIQLAPEHPEESNAGTEERMEDEDQIAAISDSVELEAEPEPPDVVQTDLKKVDVSAGLGQDKPDSKPVEFQAADIAEADSKADAGKEAAEADVEAEGGEKQYTTPNIGNVDTDGSNTPKLRPLDEGTVLNGRYEIVRKIGGGGMGAVYLASDKNLGGVLRAVKEMVQSYIEREQQEKAVQDFKRESMLLTSLEHSSIPTIYDYFYDEKEARFYLVMKYISGGDLAARLRAAPEGRLDEISVTQWAIDIADVLSYLHDRQPPIVYRDLKPANIMIDGNSSKIMLIDFGIARWINKEEKGVTAVGTMGYAPPELFSGNVVPSSDIYSLGSTMFHLLTGADPQNNPLLIFDFQKHPRPRQINPNLSDQMERILMRSVEYNAERRFASASEMRDELTRHLAGLKSGQVSYGIKESPAAVALSDQPVFCGFCGQKIVATDMFCAFCGAKQPLAQPGVQSQEYVLPQSTARLVVEGTGDLNVPTFDLGKKENLVGRRDPMSNIFPEVDLSKYDPQTKISRKHARIWREGETYMLEDLGSSNGTVLIQSSNDTTRLAPHQSRPLSHGDKIQVGDTMLHFVIG